MRICLVYDCLFPHTVGGAERWMRNVALRLAAEGHDVTYVTLRQWGEEGPDLPGVRVVVAGPRMSLYSGPGQRRILPPLVFGAGVLWHLLRHGRGYDVVHTASFPYFSLLAAAAARPLHRFRLIVDWHEVWTRGYWREYLGPVAGTVGSAVQWLCLKVPQRAFCFARLTERRLRGAGVEVTRLEGEYAGPLTPSAPRPAEDRVVFAGRHIPEKRAPAVVAAAAEIPGLRATIFGDGPERPEVLAEIERLGVGDRVDAPGFVTAEEVERTLHGALCMVLPSRREGYGMIVVESAAAGVPSVVVAGEDNAAVELVEDGVNGFVAPSADPADLAAAIRQVREAGPQLRRSTSDWYARNAGRLSIEGSLDRVAAAYRVRA
jgi:glycosyltransferase involved in cell wall biosynthesis